MKDGHPSFATYNIRVVDKYLFFVKIQSSDTDFLVLKALKKPDFSGYFCLLAERERFADTHKVQFFALKYLFSAYFIAVQITI